MTSTSQDVKLNLIFLSLIYVLIDEASFLRNLYMKKKLKYYRIIFLSFYVYVRLYIIGPLDDKSFNEKLIFSWICMYSSFNAKKNNEVKDSLQI